MNPSSARGPLTPARQLSISKLETIAELTPLPPSAMLSRAGHPTPKTRLSLQPIPQTPSKSRAYHQDEPYLDLPSPSSSTASINTLLPCPPTSPNAKTRFSTRPAFQSLRSFIKGLVPFSGLLSQVPDGPSKPISAGVWVLLYFAFNLSLTLYNKYVLNHFPFPYTMTALHALCGTVGTGLMLRLNLLPDQPPLPNLDMKESVVVFLFSLLYTVNIVVSNASLKLVTIPVSADFLPTMLRRSQSFILSSSTKSCEAQHHCSLLRSTRSSSVRDARAQSSSLSSQSSSASASRKSNLVLPHIKP